MKVFFVKECDSFAGQVALNYLLRFLEPNKSAKLTYLHSKNVKHGIMRVEFENPQIIDLNERHLNGLVTVE